MQTLILDLPDDKHQRLQELAKNQGVSINQLMDDVITRMLAEFDFKTQFEIRAQRGQGKAERALQLLNELDTLGL